MLFDILRQVVFMGLLAVAVCFELDRASAWATLEKLGVFTDTSPAPEAMAAGEAVSKVYLASYLGLVVAVLSIVWLYVVAFP